MIAVGNSNVGDIMLGEKPVLKVYAGEDLVYSRNALPYDAEVEYLQSSNQEYINTRIECNSSYTIEVEMQTDALNTECIMGARLGTNNKEHAMVLTSENKIRYKCSTSSNAVVYTPTDPSAWMHLKGLYNKFIVDGTQVGTLTASTFALTGVPYYLFAMNTNNTASNLGAKRIRMCKIWNGDTLLLDLIPVVKNSVGYMYDRVSGELLGNAGSGNFIVGPVVDLPYDYEVEYLEATSGLFINTGYVPTTNDVIIDAGLWIFNFQGSYAAAITAYTGENNNAFRIIRSNNEFTKFLVNHNTKAGGNGTTVNFPGYQKLDIRLTHTSITINGTTTNLALYSPTTANTLPIKIMGTSASSYSIGLWYYTKIWKDNTLLYDLIPVVKDNVGCMYNRVDGTFFYNAGSDDFIIGPRKQ